MTVDELMRDAAQSGKPISSVLNALAEGSIKHDDVTLHFDKMYRPIVAEHIRKFQAGDLFKNQRANFQSWLAGIYNDEDYDVYLRVASDFNMLCRKTEDGRLVPMQVDPNILDFVGLRVLWSPHIRNAIKKEGAGYGYDKFRDNWSKTNRVKGWLWRPQEEEAV